MSINDMGHDIKGLQPSQFERDLRDRQGYQRFRDRIGRWSAWIVWVLAVLFYVRGLSNLYVLGQHSGWKALLNPSDVAAAFLLISPSLRQLQRPFELIILSALTVPIVLLSGWGFVLFRRRVRGRGQNGRPMRQIVDSLALTLEEAPTARVRVAAARSLEELGALGGSISFTQLLADVREASDSSVRAAAVATLGKLGPTAPIDPLVFALRDPDAKVRQAAATALGGLGERAPLAPLMKTLQEETDREVQLAAGAAALLLLGERTPVDVLVDSLRSDPDVGVRAAAAVALGKLGNRERPDTPNSETAQSAAQAVEELREVGRLAPVTQIADAISDP